MPHRRADSAPSPAPAPDRPFDLQVVERAREVSAHFGIRVARDGDAEYVGRVTEMPAVFGCGKTDAEALSTTRELLKWALAYLIEQNRPLPMPRP